MPGTLVFVKPQSSQVVDSQPVSVTVALQKFFAGLASSDDLALLTGNPAVVRQLAGSQALKQIEEEAKEAKSAIEQAEARAAEREKETRATLTTGVVAATLTTINQTLSLSALEAELNSGQVSKPVGKANDAWTEITVGNETVMRREITTKAGNAVVDLRTKGEIEKTEIKKVVAKAVGLPLQKLGVTGRERSKLIEAVVNEAMALADSGNLDTAKPATARDAAVLEVARVVQAERQAKSAGVETTTVDMTAVQQSFKALAADRGVEMSGRNEIGLQLA